MAKKNPLGGNPISSVDPDSAVRQMVRGNRSEEIDETEAKEAPQSEGSNPPRKPDKTTVTPGGLLRKTVYFEGAEWEAIRAQAYQEDKNYSDIVRRAVRKELGL